MIEKDNKRLLSATEVMTIPNSLMPMMVLSDSSQSIVAAGIKNHSGGYYGHFMWLIAPNTCASQQTNGYKLVKLSSFLPDNRLKFWYNPSWTTEERARITKSIMKEINRPWYCNLYDFLAYPGQLFNLHWLQVPWFDICSDKMKHVAVVDKRYDLKNPDPEQVNDWLTSTPPYIVYGRYTPD